jgi:hypothetical protein
MALDHVPPVMLNAPLVILTPETASPAFQDSNLKALPAQNALKVHSPLEVLLSARPATQTATSVTTQMECVLNVRLVSSPTALLALPAPVEPSQMEN